MFGRVPRLPVDILFRSVLNDQNVVSYDKFVDMLVKDLKEAMGIAQEDATKEQKRQAALYNRRVKGLTIDVGDHVLLANKTERGKMKIADRWESAVYTVVDHKPQTHTYRIQNPATGQEKVVHRNLLLLVDFLPVPEEISVACPVSSVNGPCSSKPSISSSLKGCSLISGALPTHMADDIACENVPLTSCVHDNTDRTLSWVSHLPNVSQEPTSIVVSDDVTFNPTPQTAPTMSFDGVSEKPVDMTTDVTGNNDECHSDSASIASASTVTLAQTHLQSTSHSGVTPKTHVPLDSGSISQVRSRFGRVIKPVNRLIQTMSGQTIIQDAKHNVEAVSNSIFRAFVN